MQITVAILIGRLQTSCGLLSWETTRQGRGISMAHDWHRQDPGARGKKQKNYDQSRLKSLQGTGICCYDCKKTITLFVYYKQSAHSHTPTLYMPIDNEKREPQVYRVRCYPPQQSPIGRLQSFVIALDVGFRTRCFVSVHCLLGTITEFTVNQSNKVSTGVRDAYFRIIFDQTNYRMKKGRKIFNGTMQLDHQLGRCMDGLHVYAWPTWGYRAVVD